MRLLVVTLLVVILGVGSATATDVTQHPALKVTALSGENFDLAAQRGHWVIINFWATWCRPCIEEMPDISRYVQTHANVRAIGLAFDDASTADISAFVTAHPVVYPIAHLDVFHPPTDFGAPLGLPTTYLIAPDGHVAKKFIGPITSADLDGVIAAKAR